MDKPEDSAAGPRSEILQGTLDLMILKTLDVMGPQHGFGLAQRITDVSQQLLQPNQGTIYAALLRLQQRNWIKAKWGTSDNGRKAKFYDLTPMGRRQLSEEAEGWRRMAGVMARLLAMRPQE